MDILIFLGGFLTGVIAVAIPLLIFKKHIQTSQDKMFQEFELKFENTANKLFKESSAELSNVNREKLDDFFKRFKEKIEDFEKQAKLNLETEDEKLTRFDVNIKNFLEAGNKISQDTNSLINVMKSDNRTTGRWGEIILERVLEASGLRKDEEYKIQKGTAEGRPDATVYLPEGKCIFIDSKTSFASWYGYVNAEEENEKEVHLKSFFDSTKAHITGLAKRDYSVEDNSPDYVLMFIPVEGCYSLMFCDDCTLWDFAWKNKVMPVSPSTLLAALKIINSFYVTDRQNKNALEISRLCGGMLDKFAALLSELLKIRDNLSNSLVKLNGKDNILSRIERIEKLGGVMSKSMPEMPEDLKINDYSQSL